MLVLILQIANVPWWAASTQRFRTHPVHSLCPRLQVPAWHITKSDETTLKTAALILPYLNDHKRHLFFKVNIELKVGMLIGDSTCNHRGSRAPGRWWDCSGLVYHRIFDPGRQNGDWPRVRFLPLYCSMLLRCDIAALWRCSEFISTKV